MRIILALYVLLVIIISLLPSSDADVGQGDKLAHFLAYAVMALLSQLTFTSRRARWAALVGAVMLGAGLEFIQSLLPTRQMSLADGIANALGVVSGAKVYRYRGAAIAKWLESRRGRISSRER